MDTAQSMINRVIVRLEDPDYVFFSEQDLIDAYNDALDEISEATEINEVNIVVKRRKKAAYTDLRGILPSTALRITAVWNLNTNRWLHPTTVDELDDLLGRQWEDKPDTESRWWWMRGLWHFGAYPVPNTDASNLRIHYAELMPNIKAAGGLATGLTSSPPLPPDFTDAIENYMLYQLLAQRKETDKALEHFTEYQKHEQDLFNLAHNRMRRDRAGQMGARRGWGLRR